MAPLVQRTARRRPGFIVEDILSLDQHLTADLGAGGRRRRIALTSVDFPQPDSPARPSSVLAVDGQSRPLARPAPGRTLTV